jgi:hypothetical protein
MYLLYIDESDTTDTGKITSPRWYCISGLRVLARSHRPIQERFERILKDNKLPENFEIKGNGLYNGTGFWKDVKPEKRIDFCKHICQFINNSNLIIYSASEVVRKNDHVKSYKNLLSTVMEMVASYVSKAPKTSRQFILIFDQRPDIEEKIRDQIKSDRKEIIKKYKRSCSFIDYGFDGDSKLCWGIQIADFVAYFLRKQQTFQRSDNLFGKADNFLSMEVVDSLLKSINKKCKTKFLSKRSY